MRPPAALAAAVVLASLVMAGPLGAVQGEPGPNARPPLSTVAPVTSLAMADDGTVLATTGDPGSSAPTPDNPGPDINTWYLWGPTGAPLAAGSGDLTDCRNRLQDFCTSPVVAGSLAATGGRFAFVANVAPSVTDSVHAILAVGSASGLAVRQPLGSGAIDRTLRAVDVAMDGTGTSVAVLERITPLNGPATSRVEWFEVAEGMGLAAVMPASSMPGPATAMALSHDGGRLVVASDRLHVLHRAGDPPVALGANPPTALALAGGGLHGILWGTGGGGIHYAVDGDTIPRHSGFMGPDNVTAVAVSRDGRWGAAGDTAGKVVVWGLDEVGSPALRMRGNASVPGPVLGLQWTTDGSHLLVRSATGAHLYDGTGNLTLLWSHAPATPPVDAALSANGDLAAAAVDNGVIVYPAVRAMRMEAAPQVMQAGSARTFPVTFHNDGNRALNATFEVWFPAEWFVTATPGFIELPVDGSATVEMRVVLPAQYPPGTFHILLNHTLSTGATGTSQVPVTVASRELVVLNPQGPTSLGIRAGETVQFTAVVENLGNEAGTGRLSYSVEPSDWRGTMTPTQVSLGPGESREIAITLTAPANAQEGHSGRLRAVLAERPHEPLIFHAALGARFQPALTVPGLTAVQAGNVSHVELALQNNGNVIDSYDLAVGSLPDGWQVTFQDNGTVRDLEVGHVVPVSMQIVVPVDAAPGLRVRIDVSATSQGNPASQVERTLWAGVVGADGVLEPEPGGVNWSLVGAVLLALFVLGGLSAGVWLMRRP